MSEQGSAGGSPAPAPRARVSLWAAAAIAGLIVFSAFAAFRMSLARRAEAAAQTLIGLNPRAPVAIARKADVASPPPIPTRSARLDHIREVLAPGVDAGALSVDSTANWIIIRLANHALFRPGKASLREDVRPLLMYVALALDDADGGVRIVGHSDAEPFSNARFASNFELSLERAKTVGALLKQLLSRPEWVEAQGRGGDFPIASNETVEGRNKNSRVEILAPLGD